MNYQVTQIKILIFMVFVILSISSNAQTLISPAHSSFNHENEFYVDWTIGEPITSTVRQQDEVILTQGFHQPYLICDPCDLPLEEEVDEAFFIQNRDIDDADLKLYPNPVIDVINVEMVIPSEGITFLALYNQQGQLLRKESFFAEKDRLFSTKLNVMSHDSGQYYIRIYNSEFSATDSFHVFN